MGGGRRKTGYADDYMQKIICIIAVATQQF